MKQQPQQANIDPYHWHWQLQLLSDLTDFVQAHGPSSATPLPALDWTLGIARQARAELPVSDPDPMATLGAFARVLGSNIQERRLSGKVVHYVCGRIGACENGSFQPRTDIVVRTTTFLHLSTFEEAS